MVKTKKNLKHVVEHMVSVHANNKICVFSHISHIMRDGVGFSFFMSGRNSWSPNHDHARIYCGVSLKLLSSVFAYFIFVGKNH
jgi:hypothetical protein